MVSLKHFMLLAAAFTVGFTIVGVAGAQLPWFTDVIGVLPFIGPLSGFIVTAAPYLTQIVELLKANPVVTTLLPIGGSLMGGAIVNWWRNKQMVAKDQANTMAQNTLKTQLINATTLNQQYEQATEKLQTTLQEQESKLELIESMYGKIDGIGKTLQDDIDRVRQEMYDNQQVIKRQIDQLATMRTYVK